MLMIQHSVEISVVKIKIYFDFVEMLKILHSTYHKYLPYKPPNCPTCKKRNSNNIYSHNLLNKIA